jgi:hypothetical protein
MSLAYLLKKGGLRGLATATSATSATHGPFSPSTVATVATVAVAKAPDTKVDDPPDNPVDWHALDAAYMAHHFNCKTCIAAGRGSRYGLRCGAGAALWALYASASTA